MELELLAVQDASVDAVFPSHNIEYLYSHEVPLALAEFIERVLKQAWLCPVRARRQGRIAALSGAYDRFVSPAGDAAQNKARKVRVSKHSRGFILSISFTIPHSDFCIGKCSMNHGFHSDI